MPEEKIEKITVEVTDGTSITISMEHVKNRVRTWRALRDVLTL